MTRHRDACAGKAGVVDRWDRSAASKPDAAEYSDRHHRPQHFISQIAVWGKLLRPRAALDRARRPLRRIDDDVPDALPLPRIGDVDAPRRWNGPRPISASMSAIHG